MSGINSQMTAGQWASLWVLSVLWGGTFFFVEIGLTGLPPLSLVALRVLIASLALWGFVLATGRTVPRAAGVWGAFLVMALLNNALPWSLIFWGQQQITASLASILNATTPVFTVLIAGAVLSDERLTPLRLIGAVVGLCGAVLVIGPAAIFGLGADVLPQLAVVGAAISYSVSGVYGRRFKRMGVDPAMGAAGQVTMAALVMIPVALTFERPLDGPMPGWEVWAAVAGMALLSTAVAYVLVFRLLASAGATNFLLVTLLIPVSAVTLGVVFLGETLLWSHGAGLLVIGLGLSLIDGRLWLGRRHAGRA